MPEWQTDIQLIEQMDSDVLNTTQELQNLQWSINGLSDEKKAEMLSENAQMLLDIEQTIKACRDECNRLEQENKAENAEKLNQLKANLANLEQIYNQLTQQISSQTNAALSELSDEASVNQNQTEQNQETPEQEWKEKKWIRWWWHWLNDWTKKWIRTRWWVLAWIWIFSLFRRRWPKGSPESSWKSRRELRREKREARRAARRAKPFWDRPIWKIVKWTGIGTWAYYISRWLITGNWSIFWWNPFSKEKKDWPSTSPGSKIERSEKAYDKLSEDDKKIYEDSAMAINDYQWNIMWDNAWSFMVEDLMWDSNFDKDKIWLIPFILSNRYANLGKMLSETSIYYEIAGTEWHIAWDKLKKLWLDGLKKLLEPLVWIVNWLTFDLLNLDEWLDKLIDRLKWVEWLEQILRTVFRKSITVMSYYQSRKWALEVKLAEQELLKSDPSFANMSEEDKIEEISDRLQDEERYKQYIEPEVSNFMNLNIKNATVYLQEKWLLNGELDACMKLSMDKIDRNRRDLLWIEDDDDTSILEDLKSELSNWRLSERAQKKLKDLCEDFEEEIFTMWKQSWYMKYLPMFQIFSGWEKLMNDIQQCWDYENIASKYMEQVNNILKKSEDGTLQESDLDLLEETINDYYKFQKSLVSSEMNLEQSVDDNWNIVLRWWRSIWAWWETIWSWIQIITWAKEGTPLESIWLMAGWILSIDALTFWIVGRKLVWFSPFWALNKKVVFPVAKGGVRLVWKWFERLTWNAIRANLPSVISYKLYNADTFRIAVWRGDISLERAAKIAYRQKLTYWAWNMAWNGKLVETSEDVVQYLFWSEPAQAKRIVNIVDKYGDNPKIYRELFSESYQNVSGKRRKPQERFHLNRSNMKFNLNETALKRLEDIAVRIDRMPAWTQKTVMESMMRSVKTIDQAEDIAIMWVWDDMAKLLESWKFMKAEEYWKYLAKYAGKIDPNDMRAFEKFLIEAKNWNKIWWNSKLFVRNAMKNFTKIKSENFAIGTVEKLSLNSSRRSKLAESTKANCGKMVNRLRSMAKNPKFKPFHANINKQAECIEEVARCTNENSIKAMRNYSLFSRETAFTKLTGEWMHELSRLSYMLRDVDMAKDLSKALRTANTVDDVKAVLRWKWIAVEAIDDAVLMKIAKTKNAQHIKDIVNYWAEFRSLQWINKALRNPAFKVVWKTLWRALVVADVALVGYNFYSQYNEAQEVKKYNLERGEWKEWQSYFDLAMWWIWAVAWACMLIPWYWWIAGWVLFASMAVMEVWNKYFEDIEKFKQNQKDFLAKWIAATKQELTTVDSREQWLSRTRIDSLSVLDNNWTWILDPLTFTLWKVWESSVEKKSEWAPKTKASALQALIRMEEIQKNPLAGADLNDPEVLKDSELVEAIRVAKQQVEEIVQKRFAYFQTNYLDQNKPLIDKDSYNWDKAIAAIESTLEMSSIAMVMDSDESYKWEKNPEKYKEVKLQELKEWSEWNYSKLEKLYEENPIQLFQMYAELPFYKSMLIQYWDENSTKLMESCEYFEKYMSYKILWKPITALPTIDIDPENIDYNPIHNFLSHFALIPTLFEKEEAISFEWRLSDQDILEKYWVSGNMWQDILFECAKLLSYDWKNSLEELKLFFNEWQKEVNGFYFDQSNNTWYVNEDRARDDSFATDAQLNSLENIENMRRYVNANVNKWWSWKMFTESSVVNREIWNKMVQIIDNYISLRKWQNQIKSGIDDYIKTHATNGNYIYLPYDLIIKGRKAWLEWIWTHLYWFENWWVSMI